MSEGKVQFKRTAGGNFSVAREKQKHSQYQLYLISVTVHKVLNFFPLFADLLQESLTFKSNELMELRNYTGNRTSNTEKG